MIYLHQALLRGLHERGMRVTGRLGWWWCLGLKTLVLSWVIFASCLCVTMKLKLYSCRSHVQDETKQKLTITQHWAKLFKSSGVTPKEQHIIDTLEEFVPEQLGRMQIPCCMWGQKNNEKDNWTFVQIGSIMEAARTVFSSTKAKSDKTL